MHAAVAASPGCFARVPAMAARLPAGPACARLRLAERDDTRTPPNRTERETRAAAAAALLLPP